MFGFKDYKFGNLIAIMLIPNYLFINVDYAK